MSHYEGVGHWHNVDGLQEVSLMAYKNLMATPSLLLMQWHGSPLDLKSQVLFRGESDTIEYCWPMWFQYFSNQNCTLNNVDRPVRFQWSSRIAPIPQSTVLHRLEYPPTLKWLLGAEARASFCPNVLGWVSKRGCGAAPLTGGPVGRFKQARNI